MALNTYNDLLESVKGWLHRDDLTAITPDFVRLAEVEISADLKLQALDKSTTINVIAGTKIYDLPTDMLRLIRIEGKYGKIDAFSPDDKISTQGFYIEIGKLHLKSEPLENETLTIYYKSNPLNLAGEMNQIYLKYPNIYLYGTLKESAPYIGDDRNIQVWEAKYVKAIAIANKHENYKKTAILGSELSRMVSSGTYDVRIE